MTVRRLVLAVALAVLAPASTAIAGLVPAEPIAGNPADEKPLSGAPIDPARYQPASRCTHHTTAGIHALVWWLSAHSIGEDWGSYRCERWGKHSASLHAEGRAEDCYDRSGHPRRVDDTTARRDHLHIGLNWPGARLRTSFWRAPESVRR